MALEGNVKKTKTGAKTGSELTTNGGKARATLTKLSNTVSNNKKTLTLAGAAVAGVAAAAGAVAVVKRRKSKAAEAGSLITDPGAAETAGLREV